MNFTCDKAKLLKEITTAQDVIASKTSFSVLSNVLLSLNDDFELTIKATNLSLRFETHLSVQPPADFSSGDIGEKELTIFCDRFLALLKNLPDGVIAINDAPGGVEVSSLEATRSTAIFMRTLSAEKFPSAIDEEEKACINLHQQDLLGAIEKTLFSVSTDETRYFMTGVYFEADGHDLKTVSTDGKRLAFTKIELSQEPNFDPVIVPPRVLSIVRKLLGNEGSIEMHLHSSFVSFCFDDVTLSSQLIEGTFPNYHRVIPESQHWSASFESEAFQRALRTVSVFCDPKIKKIFLEFSADQLTLSASESDIGEASETIGVTYGSEDFSEPIKFAMNADFLLEPLKYSQSEQLSFGFSEAQKAVTLSGADTPETFYIIMPMQS